MQAEMTYLINALEMSGRAIMVRRVHIENGTVGMSRIEYMSPNLGKMGLNINVIAGGLRLPEDYIHPEDRYKMVANSEKAAKEGKPVSDIIRVVGEDGEIKQIDFTTIFIESESHGAELVYEYIMKAHDGEGEVIPLISGANIEIKKDKLEISEFISNNKALSVVQSLTFIEDLYSTFVDLEGRNVVRPTGPDAYLGIFYDLFERPTYKSLYGEILEKLEGAKKSIVCEVGDIMEGSMMSAAPIMINGKQVATWLICSYTKESSEKLSKISMNQWNMAGLVGSYLETVYNADGKASEIYEIEKKLTAELEQKRIITDAMVSVKASETDALKNMFEEVGKHMKLDAIAFYSYSNYDRTGISLNLYWDKNGNEPEEFMDISWNIGAHADKLKDIQDDGMVVGHDNITNKMRAEMKGGIRAFIVQPLFIKGEVAGCIAFVQSSEERNWNKQEIEFTKEVKRVVERAIRHRLNSTKTKTSHILLEAFNYVDVEMFVRENSTGKVLFSNSKINEHLGYDFVGKDSRMLLTDLRDRFEDVVSIRKRAFNTGEVNHWQKYIDAFDSIYDITQIKLMWDGNIPASCIVLKKSQS